MVEVYTLFFGSNVLVKNCVFLDNNAGPGIYFDQEGHVLYILFLSFFY